MDRPRFINEPDDEPSPPSPPARSPAGSPNKPLKAAEPVARLKGSGGAARPKAPDSIPASLGRTDISPPPRPARSGWIVWIFILLGGAALAPVVFWLWRGQASSPIAAATGDIFQNPARNYAIQLPSREWRSIPTRRGDLLFEHVSANATLRISSTEAGRVIPLGAAEEELRNHWEADYGALSHLRRQTGQLAGFPAIKIEASGTQDGQTRRLLGLVVPAGDISYGIELAARPEAFDQAVADFNSTVEHFRLLAPRQLSAAVVVKADEPPDGPSVIVGKNFPYRLRLPSGGWKEVTELPFASRFADRLIANRDGSVSIVVAPRRVADAGVLERAYADRMRKLFPGAKVAEHAEARTIGGRPAHVLELTIEDRLEPVYVQTAFLTAGVDGARDSKTDSSPPSTGPVVYQIECRCSADQAGKNRELFSQVFSGLELDSPAHSSVQASKTAPADTNVPKAAMEKKAPPPPPDAPKKPSPPPPAAATAPVPKNNAPAAAKPSPPSAPAKSRKSLDDLD